MLAEAALLLCLSANTTVDVAARAELRTGAAAGYSDQIASSMNLRLLPVLELARSQRGISLQAGYQTDLRVRGLGLAFIPFSTHTVRASVAGGRALHGVRARLRAGTSLGQVSFDPLLDDPDALPDDQPPTGLAALGDSVAIPFTSANVGLDLDHRQRFWDLNGGVSGRFFDIPLLDEEGELVPGADPLFRLGPSARLGVAGDVGRLGDRLRFNLEADAVLAPERAELAYYDLTAQAAWSREIAAGFPLDVRAGYAYLQVAGFTPGLLPVGRVSLGLRLPEKLRASLSGGLSTGFDPFNDAGTYGASASARVSRFFTRFIEADLTARVRVRTLLLSFRPSNGDDVVTTVRAAVQWQYDPRLLLQGGAVLSARTRYRDQRQVFDGQLFIAATGGGGWES